MRVTPIACVAALLLAVGGCGGDSTTSAAGDRSGAAALVPADVAAFASLNTDTDSDQVEQLREVAERFPIADDALDHLARALGEEDLSWEEDVEPALGPEVAVAVLADGERFVALTQPDDPAKLDALIAQADVTLVTREVEGWHVIGETRDLEAFEAARGGDTLADSDAYADAFDGLADDVLAKVYASGAALEEVAGELGGVPVQDVGSFETAGVVLEAVGDGIRIDGRATGVEGVPADFEPQLLERVPADAFLAVSFSGLDDVLSNLRSSDIPFLPDAERALGVTFDELGTIFAGEGVLYARSGLPIPEVTLAVQPENVAGALATLRTLADTLAGIADSSVQQAEVDGVQVQYVEVEGVRVQFTEVDGAVIVTTGIAGIRDFREEGDKLTSTDAYADAAESAGLGDRTNGLLYLNFVEALPVIEGLAGLAGEELPAEVRENLEPLESLFVQGHVQDGELRFGGVLKVR